jgi:hypothetical protein
VIFHTPFRPASRRRGSLEGLRYVFLSQARRRLLELTLALLESLPA